jgi:hypothetical protein
MTSILGNTVLDMRAFGHNIIKITNRVRAFTNFKLIQNIFRAC